MSQPQATPRCSKAPLTKEQAKETIKSRKKNHNKTSTCNVLNLEETYYDTRIATFIRKGLRERDTVQLTGEALHEKKNGEGDMLCDVGGYPQFFHYGVAKIIDKTIKIRFDLRQKFLDLFDFTLRRTKQNDKGKLVYRPDYTEIEDLLICMVRMEAQRMISSKQFRTEEGDLNSKRRYTRDDSPSGSPSSSS